MMEILTRIILGLAVSLVVGPLGIWIANRLRLIDIPGHTGHTIHQKPTPMAGGIVLVLSLVVLLPLMGPSQTPISFVLISGLMIFLLGSLDDAIGLSAPQKFAGQILASVMLIASEHSIHFLNNIGISFFSPAILRVLDGGLTIVWLVGITNAFNLMDSMDGLAVGAASIAFAFFTLMAFLSHQVALAGFSAISLGICIGMYSFNQNPARLFLGDAGALTLGFVLAAVALIYAPLNSVPQSSSWFIPIMVLGFPIFDTTLVTISRLRRHVSIFNADRAHIYHRLIAMNIPSIWAVAIIHAICLLLGASAMVALTQNPIVANLLFILAICAAALLILLFERMKFSSKGDMVEASETLMEHVKKLVLFLPGKSMEAGDGHGAGRAESASFEKVILPRIDNQALGSLVSGRMNDVGWDSYAETDWNHLINKAEVEGVSPLLYWVFSQSGGFAFLPKVAQNRLRLSYAGTWWQNQEYFKELETLSHLFAQAEIPVVLLKGACFALTIYADPGLRPMGDLDILVPASKIADAVQIANSLGYSNSKPETSLGMRDLLNHEICLQRTDSFAYVLEIHHSLVADQSFKFAVPVEWFWNQTEPFKIDCPMDFEKLLMLSPVAQILYAAGHAMLQHGGGRTPLRWYYDIDRLIRVYNTRLDWDLLVAQARVYEWGSALCAALQKVNLYFDTPIPKPVLKGLSVRPDRHSQLVSMLQFPPVTSVFEEYQRLISLNGYGRFRLVLGLLFPDPAYMYWRYQFNSFWLLPFFYLFRWMGMVKDGFWSAIMLIQGKIKPVG